MAGGAQRSSVSDLSAGGTASTIANDPTAGTREALTTGQTSGTRAVHDSAPFDSRGGVADPTVSGTRAVNDSEPFAGNAVINDNQAAMNAGRGGSLTGDMSVASHMADAGNAESIRAIHDVAPFDSGISSSASTGGEFLTGDARLDPGTDSSHGFVPSDSADVQREMLDASDHGNALGNTGTGHPS
jgi:hypothetical protein